MFFFFCLVWLTAWKSSVCWDSRTAAAVDAVETSTTDTKLDAKKSQGEHSAILVGKNWAGLVAAVMCIRAPLKITSWFRCRSRSDVDSYSGSSNVKRCTHAQLLCVFVICCTVHTKMRLSRPVWKLFITFEGVPLLTSAVYGVSFPTSLVPSLGTRLIWVSHVIWLRLYVLTANTDMNRCFGVCKTKGYGRKFDTRSCGNPS